MIRRLCVAVSLAVALLSTAGTLAAAAPSAYSAAEIRGWVVDAETKQPLEGVHVVAQWILSTGFIHARHSIPLHITEALTDSRGEYHFSAWGPKPRPTFARLDSYDPILTYFKPGYQFVNKTNTKPHDGQLRTSQWNGKTVTLAPFRGGVDEWARHLWLLQGRIHWGMPTEGSSLSVNDYWRYMPRLVLEILNQQRLLPITLRTETMPLASWETSEDQLLALIRSKGQQQ